MLNRGLYLSAVLACLLSSAALYVAEAVAADAPQADAAALLETIRANGRALVSINLQLSAEESARFWPLYERYHKELGAIGDREAVIITDYAASFRELSNDKALKLMDDYLKAQAERAKVRAAYLPEFAKILPGRTVARFYQIENKMDAVLRYDLASTIPVVDEKTPAAKP